MTTLKLLEIVNEAIHPHQEHRVSEQASCAMCDSMLEIRHEINTNGLKVKEEAHCPCCGIRVRVTQHLLH
jgi:hypothetical protein